MGRRGPRIWLSFLPGTCRAPAGSDGNPGLWGPGASSSTCPVLLALRKLHRPVHLAYKMPFDQR